MIVQVQSARASEPFVGAGDTDVFVAPSGAQYEYRGPRIVSVNGQPSFWDEVSFVRHIARRTAGQVRVLGISLGGDK